MSYGKSSRGIKSDNQKIGNTRHLTRILTILQEQAEPIIKNKFRTDYGLNSNNYNDALNWLVCNGIVLKEHYIKNNLSSNNISTWTYRINPKFLELKPNQPQKTRVIKLYEQNKDNEAIQELLKNEKNRQENI